MNVWPVFVPGAASTRMRQGLLLIERLQRELAQAINRVLEPEELGLAEWMIVSELAAADAPLTRVARRLGVVGEEIGSSELRMLASAAEAAQRMGRLALGASTDNIGHPVSPGSDPEEFRDIPVDEYLRARARAIEDV